MYPARILNRKLYPAHLGIEWLEGYRWIHDQRIHKWKSLAKKDKVAAAYSEVYKLAMNGGKNKFGQNCTFSVIFVLNTNL